MASKKPKPKTTIYGGDVYRATGGGAIATGNARLASQRARQVTDSAMASFGRSIGPYGAGATEHAAYTSYEPNPYAYEDQWAYPYEDPYYVDPYEFDPYYGEQYATDDPYMYDVYDAYGMLSDLADDGGLDLYAGAATPFATPVDAGTGGTGFWGSLGSGVTNLLGGVGNLLGGVLGGVTGLLNTAGTATGSIGPEISKAVGSINDSALRDAVSRLTARADILRPEKSTLDKVLPLLALGGGAFLLYKAMKK